MNLTKRAIDNAVWHGRQGTADYRWDDELACFGIRIYPSGRKSFVVSYRLNRRSYFYTLGKYGPMTVHEARIRAHEVLAAVGRGENPAGTRTNHRASPTVEDLATRYMAEHARPRKRASSVGTDDRIWRLHILPALGRYAVADIDRAMVSDLHTKMSATPFQANRSLALLSKALRLAEIWGLRSDGSNPCRSIQRFPEPPRQRFLSTREIHSLETALRESERTQSESPAAIAAIRLLLLTGCRVGEILSLRWQDVDIDHGRLRLPTSKTGPKTIALCKAAVEILSTIPRSDDNRFVLQGAKLGSHFIGLTRPWFRIQARAGLDGVRLHDLRHTFASIAAEMGLSLPMIGGLLGHSQPITTARYVHLADAPRQQAAELIGTALEAAMSATLPS